MSALWTLSNLSVNYGSLFKHGVLCSAARPGETEPIHLRSRRLYSGDLRHSHVWRAEGHNLMLTPEAYVDQMFEDDDQVLLETHSRQNIGRSCCVSVYSGLCTLLQ